MKSTVKARDVLYMRVTETAGAIVQHWDGGSDDPGNILDHVDTSLIGKAINSPIVKRWIVKLVRQALVPPYKEPEPEELPPIEQFKRRDQEFVFIYKDFTVKVSNYIKEKLMSYPEAETFRKLLISKGFVLLS